MIKKLAGKRIGIGKNEEWRELSIAYVRTPVGPRGTGNLGVGIFTEIRGNSRIPRGIHGISVQAGGERSLQYGTCWYVFVFGAWPWPSATPNHTRTCQPEFYGFYRQLEKDVGVNFKEIRGKVSHSCVIHGDCTETRPKTPAHTPAQHAAARTPPPPTHTHPRKFADFILD